MVSTMILPCCFPVAGHWAPTSQGQLCWEAAAGPPAGFISTSSVMRHGMRARDSVTQQKYGPGIFTVFIAEIFSELE